MADETRPPKSSRVDLSALENAAFHAWVVLGDLLAGQPVTRAEQEDIYSELTIVLKQEEERRRRERGSCR